ncbi:hypothetical protein [Novipirellula artificiosorum]|uniref:Uncharacterized protein n=1 Tax=Novipirellula artificiosorum TaxID=2528016 RepID=A0A5C6E2U5_9BACT|nr:hypothetical protein [Novipirellula artificiosorum]TWU42824.1 hypothetical protein Poly41_11250 [Novipirellula artificiosorum]
MTLLNAPVDDRWQLKRLLLVHAKCLAVSILLTLACGFSGSREFGDPESIAVESLHHDIPLPPESKMRLLDPQNPRSIPPMGWRRTNRGWEHTSTWPRETQFRTDRSISELIALQESREPKWLQFTLEKVSQIPPLMIAVLQITAIAALIHLSRHKRAEQGPAE